MKDKKKKTKKNTKSIAHIQKEKEEKTRKQKKNTKETNKNRYVARGYSDTKPKRDSQSNWIGTYLNTFTTYSFSM